jgi:hypothetical protein
MLVNFKVDDQIEFLSDKQTEKGPSSGKVVAVGNKDTVIIKHSDDPGELFTSSKLLVKSRTMKPGGIVHWTLE